MELQVNPILYVTYAANGLLMIGLPVALGIILTRRFKLGWSLWWIGAGTLILSQIGHIPFNAALTLLFERGVLPAPPAAWQLPVNAVILGLSAGLWEELTRYATFRWWARDARTWRKAVMVGAGHGGAEAILLGALVLITFVSRLSLRGVDLAQVVPADQLEIARQQLSAYWGAAWYDSLLGALERAMTLPVQITFAVLVLQTFTRRQAFWVWLAVLWHAVIDAATVYIMGTRGVYAAEAAVGVFSLISLLMLFALRQPEPQPIPLAETPLPPPPALARVETVESPEALDNSRFG